MNSYFQRCHYCSAERSLNELYHAGNGFIVCSDVTSCNKRVAQSEQAYMEALLSEQKHLETRRGELITLIEKQRVKMGLPDKVAEHHKNEMARIEKEG